MKKILFALGILLGLQALAQAEPLEYWKVRGSSYSIVGASWTKILNGDVQIGLGYANPKITLLSTGTVKAIEARFDTLWLAGTLINTWMYNLNTSTAGLRSDLTAEILSRSLADSAETLARTNADNALGISTFTTASNLSTEISNRIAVDNAIMVSTGALRTDLIAETNARIAKDNLLDGATLQLQYNINTETNNRINANNLLGATTAYLQSNKADVSNPTFNGVSHFNDGLRLTRPTGESYIVFGDSVIANRWVLQLNRYSNYGANPMRNLYLNSQDNLARHFIWTDTNEIEKFNFDMQTGSMSVVGEIGASDIIATYGLSATSGTIPTMQGNTNFTGNVGIGKTPSYKLDVADTANFDKGILLSTITATALITARGGVQGLNGILDIQDSVTALNLTATYGVSASTATFGFNTNHDPGVSINGADGSSLLFLQRQSLAEYRIKVDGNDVLLLSAEQTGKIPLSIYQNGNVTVANNLTATYGGIFSTATINNSLTTNSLTVGGLTNSDGMLSLIGYGSSGRLADLQFKGTTTGSAAVINSARLRAGYLGTDYDSSYLSIYTLNAAGSDTEYFRISGGSVTIKAHLVATGLSDAGTGTALVISASNEIIPLTSSRRFKKNITPMKVSSDKLSLLKPVEFDYKSGGHAIGFIAEDVIKVYPQVVNKDKEGKPYSISYDQFIPLLVDKLQKQNKMIESMELRIKQLEKKR